MHILETAKTKRFIRLQFRYSNQNKKDLFSNFGNYSEEHHFTARGKQNVIFWDIVEIWKNLKHCSSFRKIFVKIHFKIGAISKIQITARQGF